MTQRGYQENFYHLYEKFQDGENRQGKAEKAHMMLVNYSGIALAEGTCLDLGCSNGIFTSALAPLFKNMVGIDYDKSAIYLVPQDERSTILFIHGDAMTLPFPDESFETIVCAQVYEHVPSDLQLFSELERVLKPGGVAFFSGPNKVFPIELHYNLPFLHWLPEKAADAYLKILGKGTHFYERSRTPWNLRKVFHNFDIRDCSIPVVRLYAGKNQKGLKGFLYRVMGKLPLWLWKLLLPFLPNLNWLLIKPLKAEGKRIYEVVY